MLAPKLGRKPPYSRAEKPRLVLDRYLDHTALPKPPAVVDRASKVQSWPMYGNDRIGDCTCAAAGHMIQAWTAYAGTEATVADDAVLAAYEAVSGYNPVTGASDNGAAEQDVLSYWRTTGIGGHQIRAFAQLSGVDSLTMAKTALDLFGSLYLGVQITESAMEQYHAGQPWTYVGDRNVLGGHAVPVQYWGTHEANEIGVVTWGGVQKLDRAWWWAYVEEAWVTLSDDWLEASGDSIEGFDLAQLEADLTGLTGSGLRPAAALEV